MNWTYALERMPSDDHENRHVVRVTSRPRKGKTPSSGGGGVGGKIDIRFFTNVDEHAIKVREGFPLGTSVRIAFRVYRTALKGSPHVL